MKNYLEGIELLQTRRKRAIISIAGKALNVIFGRVTEEELKNYKENLKGMEKDQRILIHVTEKKDINTECDEIRSGGK